jgi:hypothetical protein
MSCEKKSSTSVSVLDYNVDPKIVYNLSAEEGTTTVLMSKYMDKNEFMYYLSGDIWISSDKRFVVGDTLNLNVISTMDIVNTCIGNPNDSI